jgi:UDP-N-acetylmuramyl pentapeptide phosphotransferase/UDP-N-acetylglucosamine-1-phosphate transferase
MMGLSIFSCCLAFLFIPWSVWMVLALLLFGGFLGILPNLFKVRDEMKQVTTHSKPKWFLVGIILLLAVSFESATFFWGWKYLLIFFHIPLWLFRHWWWSGHDSSNDPRFS